MNFAFDKKIAMASQYQDLIKNAYYSFNSRDIDTVLTMLHPDVHWSNGWEGGYVIGHDEVRDYWTRQWKELDPNVDPVRIREREDGRIEVEVHQIVKDRQGTVLFDGMVRHIYSIERGLIKNMEIEKP
jgi:nuclear transport factor 2 (NTF2) superfamily protein